MDDTDKNVNNASINNVHETAPLPPRLRRSPAAARENILRAAEALLTAGGPQDLKLTEVARGAGVATATVLHHFGSIDGVQAALMERMVTALVTRVVAITRTSPDHLLSVEADQALFDAFEAPGAARLAAWLVMTGEASRLSVVRRAVDEVMNLSQSLPADPPPRRDIEDMVLASIIAALGAGLFGAPLSLLLGRPAHSAREAMMQALASHAERLGLAPAAG